MRGKGESGGYRIERARPDDVGCIADIEIRAAAIFSESDLPVRLAASATPVEELVEAQREGRLFVARLSTGRVVGFALLRRIDEVGHLEEVDVDPSHGRRGIGRALVEAAIEAVRDKGDPSITLTTYRDVPWNGPFYASMGFEIEEADAVTPGLREILEEEAERGLDGSRRVAMRHVFRRD